MCKTKVENGKVKLSVEDARDFVLGGNSLFTLRNKVTGKRFTFKVKMKEDKKPGESDLFWVKL